jgi:rhodanese-related sulfurtransferase
MVNPSASPSNVSVAELAALIAADPALTVIDVRQPAEYALGHVPSAVSIPLSIVPLRHTELPRQQSVYVICQSGGRSAQACAWLQEQGYAAVNVLGGTSAWVQAGHPTAR